MGRHPDDFPHPKESTPLAPIAASLNNEYSYCLKQE
jgi:hypothetical protein